MKKSTLLTLVLFAGSFLLSGSALADLGDGLMACYPFTGNANDVSGNGLNGTVHGATLTTDRFGNPNSAYSFNGTSNYISTNYSGILGTNPRTISLWARTSVDYKTMFPLAYGSTYDDTGNSFRCGFNQPWDPPDGATRDVTVDISNGAMAYDANISDNNWHHYVWVVPDIVNPTLADVKIYFDGQPLTTLFWQYGSGQEVVNTQLAQYVIIGGNWSGYPFYSGDIDDVRIYNRALSDTEIEELYTATVLDDILLFLEISATSIGSLSPQVFKNGNMQDTLLNKLNAVIASIDAGNYADALGQLQHDILGKVDGVATKGRPDNNDWITDPSAQLQIYNTLMTIINEMKIAVGQP
jgi:hypothetical protein